LSDNEVEQMIKDAEAHASEDKKMRELVDARNTADGMIHATEKSIKDLGDKVDAAEKSAVESAIAELKEAIKGDDKTLIETRTTALTEAASKIAEKAYAQQAEAAGADTTAGSGGSESSSADAGEEVVDAEFEEVKDNDNK
jgi:molecular chaperone DnaK